jgi:hypothetical protein
MISWINKNFKIFIKILDDKNQKEKCAKNEQMISLNKIFVFLLKMKFYFMLLCL